MNTDDGREELTHKIIGCAYKVANTLGTGFLEKVYENALAYEMRRAGIAVEQQKAVDVWYEDVVVGIYIADLIVGGSILVELKVAKALDDIHLAQCLNYLKATKLQLALLINFGTSKVEIKRVLSDR